MDAQQPVAVDPDPRVRRRLKRASEGDSEIVEICSRISSGNVNEEPHPQGSGEGVPPRQRKDKVLVGTSVIPQACTRVRRSDGVMFVLLPCR